MNFLLDTNVISEGTRPHPDRGVIDWLDSEDEESLFLSVISIAELRHGVERLDEGRRKSALDAWLTNELSARFEERLLSIDAETAHHCGRIIARSQAAGRQIGAMDALLAATAERHRLTLVTRNISDFAATGVSLFNPWIVQ